MLHSSTMKMTLFFSFTVVTFLVGTTGNTVIALSIQPQQQQQQQQRSPPSQQPSRRTFLSRTTASAFLLVANTVNAAELEDFAMPTPDEQEKNSDADAIMAARIRRKIELQKELAQPKTFTESFQKEQKKQKNLNSQTKEERRNAMCEELGRGC